MVGLGISNACDGCNDKNFDGLYKSYELYIYTSPFLTSYLLAMVQFSQVFPSMIFFVMVVIIREWNLCSGGSSDPRAHQRRGGTDSHNKHKIRN